MGVRSSPVEVQAGQDSVRVELMAGPLAAVGERSIRVRGESGNLRAEGQFPLRVIPEARLVDTVFPEKYLPADSTLDINGATKTVAQIAADFSAMLTKFEAVRSAKAQWHLAIAAVRDALPAEREEYHSLKKVLEGKLGRGNPQLLEYGFSVGSPKPVSAETKVLAAAKAKATRQLRHTMGSKQRLALSDAVTEPSVVVVAPGGKPMSGSTTTAATRGRSPSRRSPPAAPSARSASWRRRARSRPRSSRPARSSSSASDPG